MTPQFILRASLCREPHCAHGNWRPSAESEIENLGWAPGYAEPGYTDPAKGILTANWNYFPSDVTDILERAGYAIEWSDEWSTCENCGKLVRTSADNYSWQPSYVILNDCEMFCVDCLSSDAAAYLESLEDNPRTALNIASINPADYGYVMLEDRFESGWHPGQTDNPKQIYARLSDAGHSRILFRIDEVSQFYTVFSVWKHQDAR
jgi:hypothetical protein